MKQGSLPERIALALVTTCLFAFALSGCSTQGSTQPSDGAPPSTIEVRIVATQNFGQELLFDKIVNVEDGTRAMDALAQVADVETAYGGGFINAINDYRSQFKGSHSAKKDWFIYANGILSNVGALDYTLHSGDIQHWDLHDWNLHHFIPAIIGDFPEPFVHGFKGKIRPSIVVHEDSFKKEAKDIAGKLRQLGVQDISVRDISQLSEDNKESCNLIILGDMDCELVSELNQIWKRLGFYTYFNEGELVVLNPQGEIVARHKSGSGLLQSTQNPWNPNGIGASENVVWMISGVDDAGVKNAADILISHHGDFQYAYAIVIADGEIIKLPQANY